MNRFAAFRSRRLAIFLWAAFTCAIAGCGQSGPAAGTPSSPESTGSAKSAAVKPRTKKAAEKPRADKQEDAVPERPQRVVRPSVKVPRHDDKRLAQIGIHRYESKHLVLYTDIDPELAQPLPTLMDQAYAAWVDYFGPLPPDSEGNDFQMIGYIMADNNQFRDAGLMTADIKIALEGVYKDQMFWMNDQPIDYYRRHLMLHEGTHCYMTAFPNPTNRFIWYMEGMAELFRSHQTDAEGVTRFRLFPHDRETFGGLGWIRLVNEEVKKSGPRLPEGVTGMNVNDFQNYTSYSWSWALCAFLDGHPRYRERFRRIGSLVTSRSDATLELQQLFKDDWRELSEEWLIFAGNLSYGYDIERTVLDLRPGRPLAQGDAKADLEIASDRGWQSSGILVEQGKSYQIRATGRSVLATEPKPWESEPQGISIRYHGGLPLGTLVASIRRDALLERSPYTTMLEVLPVGREALLKPRVTGTLYFRVNDFWNELADNTGGYQVTVKESTAE
jgi:hypothetical protein